MDQNYQILSSKPYSTSYTSNSELEQGSSAKEIFDDLKYKSFQKFGSTDVYGDFNILLSVDDATDSYAAFDPFENELDGIDFELCNGQCDYETAFQLADDDLIRNSPVTFTTLEVSKRNEINDVVLDKVNDDNLTNILISTVNTEKTVDLTSKQLIARKKDSKEKKRRGRPETSISTLRKRIKDAEKSREKKKIRASKNNEASKIYRQKISAKKQQIDQELEREIQKYHILLDISQKLSKRIEILQDLIIKTSI